MSEESKTTEKITSVEKVKDPRRVEAGKRLGMISKQAKERKALREREQSKRLKRKRRTMIGFHLILHRFASRWHWVCWISWVGIVLRLR